MSLSIPAPKPESKPLGWKSRLCAECGAEFVPNSYQQTFCSAAHRLAFHNRAAVEGRAFIAFAKAWRVSRNSKGSAKLGAVCLSEMSRILDSFISADAKEGRTGAVILGYARTCLREENAFGEFQDRRRKRGVR